MNPRRSARWQNADDGRQAHARELMLAVGARLLAEARFGGAFPTATSALADFRERIAPELAEDEHLLVGEEESDDLPRGDYKLSIGDPEPNAVRLNCRYGSHSISEALRIDGVLEEGAFGVGISIDDPGQRIPLTPEEQEVSRLAGERLRADRGAGVEQPRFRGAEFRGALAAPPQPGAVVRILAVELYDDGVGVRFTYDDPVEISSMVPLYLYEIAEVAPPIEEMVAEARAEGGNPPVQLSVADDVGTRYRLAGGSRGGVQVAEGGSFFAPGLPDTATRLTVTTYAGAVEFDLRRRSV